MTIWSILRPLEIFHVHLVYFVVIWYIFPCFGILYQEKSGNPGSQAEEDVGGELLDGLDGAVLPLVHQLEYFYV
jgi:hypothetical protein